MNAGDRKPNILFIVWDACRYSYAKEHASFLNELAASNISFENAIAPSPWSLPSHASIFTGKYPHEHGSNRFGDSIETPLVRELSDRNYTTYGVSANGFASQRTGFDEDFDEFRYTGGRDKYVDGMDVSGTAQRILNQDGGTLGDALTKILRRIPRQDQRVKSLANLATVGLGELATKFKGLQRIPYPAFAPTSDYSYTPNTNTRAIQSMLADHDESEPFFLFTNYMDTHRCYKPAPELQQKHIGRTLGYDELVRLNEEVAAPWEFESKKARGELDETDVETLRGLYAGEVETVDRHLKKIYETLEDKGLLSNTLVVVTADHGENLGETDEMGRTRMGHEASVSDAVLRVPLVVANPELNAETIDSEFSLESLYDVFVSVATTTGSNTAVSDAVSGSAVSQYPATGGTEQKITKYPDVPEEDIQYSTAENAVALYSDGWKVVGESTGDWWTFEDGTEKPKNETPDTLITATDEYLTSLAVTNDDDLSDDQVSQLEALGYI